MHQETYLPLCIDSFSPHAVTPAGGTCIPPFTDEESYRLSNSRSGGDSLAAVNPAAPPGMSRALAVRDVTHSSFSSSCLRLTRARRAIRCPTEEEMSGDPGSGSSLNTWPWNSERTARQRLPHLAPRSPHGYWEGPLNARFGWRGDEREREEGGESPAEERLKMVGLQHELSAVSRAVGICVRLPLNKNKVA